MSSFPYRQSWQTVLGSLPLSLAGFLEVQLRSAAADNDHVLAAGMEPVGLEVKVASVAAADPLTSIDVRILHLGPFATGLEQAGLERHNRGHSCPKACQERALGPLPRTPAPIEEQ